MKIKIIILSLFLINFSQANEMVQNQYEIIFNNEGQSHSLDKSGYSQEEINESHNSFKNQNNLIENNKNNLFKECIKKSNNLINFLDNLKKIPETERVAYLYNNNYLSGLQEEERNKTLLILNKIEKISDEQYIIIKGKIASIFKEECIALTNN